jgi:hypothetical protein
VVISKAESGADYVPVARGTWFVGREPALTGEPIPPEVMKGFEVQLIPSTDRTGTVRHDRAEVHYAMEYEVIE